MHKAVLLNEVLNYLGPREGDFIIDGTVDGGGHAAAIMEMIMPSGKFLGVDWDETMITRREDAKIYPDREYYVNGNYAELPEIISHDHLGKADGLLLDLGFSSDQLEHSGRGFSFSEAKANEPLLMTYHDARMPVARLLRELKEEDLADIIFKFGGERLSRRIAKAIKDREREHRILTSGELANVIRSSVPAGYEEGRIDPATRTFQALRIYANDELENLKTVLGELPNILKPGGRIVIISFHSLEDSIVKETFQKLKQDGVLEITTKKAVAATEGEVSVNPRSRSAKLRAGIML